MGGATSSSFLPKSPSHPAAQPTSLVCYILGLGNKFSLKKLVAEMKTIILKNKQGFFLLQALKIPLEGFGAEFRFRAPPVPLPGTAPNVVEWFVFLFTGPPELYDSQTPCNWNPL